MPPTAVSIPQGTIKRGAGGGRGGGGKRVSIPQGTIKSFAPAR